jgi:hypothetical protein
MAFLSLTLSILTGLRFPPTLVTVNGLPLQSLETSLQPFTKPRPSFHAPTWIVGCELHFFAVALVIDSHLHGAAGLDAGTLAGGRLRDRGCGF